MLTQNSKKKQEKEKKKVLACGQKFVYNVVTKGNKMKTVKEQIIDYVEQHPNCTTFECKESIGCTINYVRIIFRQIGYKAPIVQPKRIKYVEGSVIGTNNVFFKQRLDSNNGIFVCPICGKEFKGDISGVGKGLIKSCGCLLNMTARNKTFKDLTGQKFGKLTVQYCLPYSTVDNRAIWHCTCECGGEKDVVGKLLRQGHTISCGCSNSKGEVKLRQIFISLGVKFEEQKTFDDFTNKKNYSYRFDFYLPDYNTCLEYDGVQHYKTTGWQTEERLAETKDRDSIKNSYCIKNNITLIRIPYTHYNDMSEETISNLLKGVKDGTFQQVCTFGEV